MKRIIYWLKWKKENRKSVAAAIVLPVNIMKTAALTNNENKY